jgi:hypothetical protein
MAATLRVNGLVGALEAIDDPHGVHYVLDGLTWVIDPEDLCVEYGERRYRVANEQLSRGRCGDTIAIELGDGILMRLSGVYTVDEQLVFRFEQTELYDLVKDRLGCLTVGALEMIHAPSDQAQTGRTDSSSYATARSGTPQPSVA